MLRKILLGLAVLAAVAIAVPFLVPVDHYIPRVAALASEKLGHPVSIEDLELRLLPTPRLVASDIAVGRKREVKVGELEIVPDLLSLLSGSFEIRLVRAEEVDVDEAALGALFPKSAGGGDAFELRRIELRQLRLVHSSFRLAPMDVDASLGDGLRVEHVRIESGDGALEVDVAPETATIAQFKVRGRLYGGTLEGSARADWTKQWQLTGQASLDSLDAVALQRMLGKPARLTGRVKAEGAFSSRARSAGKLLDALSVDALFEVLGGAYHGVDLSKVGDLTATRAEGDVTPFDEFKGQLQLRGKLVKITSLCVRSPKLIAGGSIDIAEDQKLSGKLSVSVAKTGGFVGVPVVLSGTTAEPGVSPSRGYTLGAVAGTLLLPGIGTALGASAASALEGTEVCK